ncbi:hematopoietic progenitor cell antigen CD34 [Diceros bicornis minor]|uniref:hematopoietic progenitor cell antigen CD34 n=1 Tax=Diceros bicornis minor TaxID=77932 RepID=UPI0026EA84E1|nr:hematopoietic progenitor cell antigen CD34 [Diceros bicornis minor]
MCDFVPASGFTCLNSTSPGTVSVVPTTVSNKESIPPSALGSTSLHPVSQESSGTTAAISETPVNFTSTSGLTPFPTTVNSSVQSQTSLTITVSSTTINFSTTEMTLKSHTSPRTALPPAYNSMSPMTYSTKPYTSFYPTSAIIRKEIKCSTVKDVKLTQGICLLLNETSTCEDFKKKNEKTLIRVLCEKEQAENGIGACSLLFVPSEVKPRCQLLVLANRTELSSKLQLLKNHQSELRGMRIQDFTEEDLRSHQSYSHKTLIALITLGILLAVLGIMGYFLMNRRSWRPTGERLGEDPYYTENGGGQGYSSGPGASPEAQGKASVNRGAQENGTGQATSRNGHSARQHVVADTEL